MSKKVVIGVIGCGRISDFAHFPAFATLTNVRIKYACDLIIEKAEKAKEKYPQLIENVIADYKVIIADKEVDAVYVLTPNYLHYDIAMEALQAKKHVFCEKPITVNYELSCKMAEEAKKQNKMLVIGVCNRFNKSVEMLEEMNRRGDFGKIYHVYCSFRSFRNIPGLGGSFTDKSKSGGGVLIDWGVHFLDLILYILGGAKLKTVSADAYSEMAKNINDYKYTGMWAEDTKELNGVNNVEDFITGYIRTDKSSVSFNGAWAQNINKEEMYIDFLGDKGGARLIYGDKFTFYTTINGVLQTLEPNYNIPPHYTVEDKAFIDAVENNGAKLKNDISEILESAKLLDYLYKSAERKEEIKL